MLQILVVGEAVTRYVLAPLGRAVVAVVSRNLGVLALAAGVVLLLEVAGVPVAGWAWDLLDATVVNPIWTWLAGDVWQGVLDVVDGVVDWVEEVIFGSVSL